jgi:hypothetical protein
MDKKLKKLALRTETLRRLAEAEVGKVAAGRPMQPLTFVPCDTANCITLGPACPTHDCGLTFTSCGFTCIC